MKEYEVGFLSIAYDDLANAINNISQVSDNAAVNFLNGLDRQTEYLKKTPEMYPLDENHPPYRKMVLGDYLLFYIIDEKKHEVEISRILPARMELSRFFS